VLYSVSLSKAHPETGVKTMNDTEILQQINELVNEEHVLLQKKGQGALEEDQHARIQALEVALDQCWDLLRQRRARREFGQNPDEVQPRDPAIVEHFQQ
jgi:Protein of unknown function (DUF2630)